MLQTGNETIINLHPIRVKFQGMLRALQMISAVWRARSRGLETARSNAVLPFSISGKRKCLGATQIRQREIGMTLETVFQVADRFAVAQEGEVLNWKDLFQT